MRHLDSLRSVFHAQRRSVLQLSDGFEVKTNWSSTNHNVHGRTCPKKESPGFTNLLDSFDRASPFMHDRPGRHY
jgi:hypothetical protein